MDLVSEMLSSYGLTGIWYFIFPIAVGISLSIFWIFIIMGVKLLIDLVLKD